MRCTCWPWAAWDGTQLPEPKVARRTAEGRTKPEIIRCLKRYIARELYPVLLAATSTPAPTGSSSSPPEAA